MMLIPFPSSSCHQKRVVEFGEWLSHISLANKPLYELNTFDHGLSCAASTIHLATASLGFGIQWLSLIPPIADTIKTALGIPLELTVFNLNPLGYPVTEPVPYCRELSELVNYNDNDYDIA